MYSKFLYYKEVDISKVTSRDLRYLEYLNSELMNFQITHNE